jgi:ribulose-bisphosphate carboxylase large chain
MNKLDFINLEYKPTKKDLICLFKINPAKNLTIKEAANIVALESSVGTWTNVQKQEYVKSLRAVVFFINKNYVKIAYSSELFEYNNVPNILSSIAGNIFGMNSVKSIRLQDVSFPKLILNSFKGPKYGIYGIRKFMKIKYRPFIGTIIKPKIGLNSKDHSKSAYDSWIGGCDFVKDDENLSSQRFNLFEERLSKTLEMADKAESETGEKKAYLINITAETKEMLKRAKLTEEMGGKYVMIDILTAGWAALQTLRNENFKLAIHAHRAMHAAFDRNPEHGIDMKVLANFSRLIGVDQIHTGTGIGKLEGKVEDIKELVENLELKNILETKNRLNKNWNKIKPVLAVSSGGLHPGHVPFLINHFGNNIILQAGGGIHWNPKGSEYGARGMRQAVESVLKGISLKEYSRNHNELREALDKFGYPKIK